MVALALIGLICIGLMGLGAVMFYTRSNQAQQSAVEPLPTFTPLPPSVTPTDTPSATATNTPLPTPTGTPVVPRGDEQPASVPDNAQTGDGTPEPEATEEGGLQLPTVTPGGATLTPTNTAVVQPPTSIVAVTGTTTPDAVSQIPNSGGIIPPANPNFLIWAGVGLLLILTLGAVYHFKSSPTEN